MTALFCLLELLLSVGEAWVLGMVGRDWAVLAVIQMC